MWLYSAQSKRPVSAKKHNFFNKLWIQKLKYKDNNYLHFWEPLKRALSLGLSPTSMIFDPARSWQNIMKIRHEKDSFLNNNSCKLGNIWVLPLNRLSGFYIRFSSSKNQSKDRLLKPTIQKWELLALKFTYKCIKFAQYAWNLRIKW